MVGVAALAVATACTAQPPGSTTMPAPTPTTPSEAEALEAALEAVFVRTGLGHLDREEMILQPMASIPTLTFNLGSACSGQIEMPDDTRYVIKIYPRDLSMNIIDVTLPVGYPGKLSDAEIAKVAGKCPV